MIEFFNDTAKEHFENVKAFAEKVGALDEFMARIKFLDEYGSDSKCELWKDFTPHSFTFLISIKKGEEYHPLFNGGLIYSGPGLPADGSFPSLTVSLDKDASTGARHMWGIHT